MTILAICIAFAFGFILGVYLTLGFVRSYPRDGDEFANDRMDDEGGPDRNMTTEGDE